VSLVRGLTLIAAMSVVVGNVIGTGVFLKARVMTCNVGTPGKVLAVYVIAGLLSLAGALSYAELAAMMPRAGGEYVFMREAYGRPWGFLFGWMSFFIGKAGSQAALGVQFALFLNTMIRGRLDGQFFSFNLFGHPIPFGKVQVVALASILIVTGINCLAVKFSGGVAAVLSGVKIALVLVVGVGAFLLASGADWSHLGMANVGGACENVSAAARVGFGGVIAAMLGALWAYDGWNNVTLVAGEVQNPQRNLPRALIGGMLLIMGLFLLLCAVAHRRRQCFDDLIGRHRRRAKISRPARHNFHRRRAAVIDVRNIAHLDPDRRPRSLRDGPRWTVPQESVARVAANPRADGRAGCAGSLGLHPRHRLFVFVRYADRLRHFRAVDFLRTRDRGGFHSSLQDAGRRTPVSHLWLSGGADLFPAGHGPDSRHDALGRAHGCR